MDIFLKVLLSEKIKIEPKYISKNVRSELKSRLVMKLEGICSKHGYIRKSSIEIYKIRPGLVELISLNGYIQYDVFFHADVCNPLLGTLISAKQWITSAKRPIRINLVSWQKQAIKWEAIFIAF